MNRRITWRPLAAVLSAGGATAAVLWVVGVAPGFALAVGALVLVAVVAGYAFAGVDAPGWDAESIRARRGGRPDVANLAWSLRHVRGDVADAGLARLRSYAARRFALLGYDLEADRDRAALESLLGAETFGILTDPSIHPRLPAVERAVDRLESIPTPSGRTVTPS